MNYQAQYKEDKINALAISIKSIVDSKVVQIDKMLPSQMINVGIRKLHDNAQSPRGKGKYLGHPIWSKKALKILELNDGRISNITKYLSHEHLVPLNIIVNKLLEIPQQAGIDIYKNTIIKFAAVVIITREEEQLFRAVKLSNTMPVDWCGSDVFARYKKVRLFNELVET